MKQHRGSQKARVRLSHRCLRAFQGCKDRSVNNYDLKHDCDSAKYTSGKALSCSMEESVSSCFFQKQLSCKPLRQELKSCLRYFKTAVSISTLRLSLPSSASSCIFKQYFYINVSSTPNLIYIRPLQPLQHLIPLNLTSQPTPSIFNFSPVQPHLFNLNIRPQTQPLQNPLLHPFNPRLRNLTQRSSNIRPTVPEPTDTTFLSHPCNPDHRATPARRTRFRS